MTRRLLLVLPLAGCILGDGKYLRPSELESVAYVDRLRVLAVVAEPPEARPGDTVRFSALVADPDGDSPLVAWLACDPNASDGYGCSVDLGSMSDEMTPEQLEEMGVIGLEPGLPPVYVPDAALLDGLDARARKEGVNVTVQIAAFPAEFLLDPPDEFDYNAVEVAYKRLVVSEATTPNHNPVITGFSVDGFDVPDGAVVEIDAGQPYTLGISLSDDSVETYEYETTEGIVEERVEEPYATWYCTVTGVDEYITLHPFLEADFVAPLEAGDGTCWAVVRDRRGGMAWRSQQLTIR